MVLTWRSVALLILDNRGWNCNSEIITEERVTPRGLPTAGVRKAMEVFYMWLLKETISTCNGAVCYLTAMKLGCEVIDPGEVRAIISNVCRQSCWVMWSEHRIIRSNTGTENCKACEID